MGKQRNAEPLVSWAGQLKEIRAIAWRAWHEAFKVPERLSNLGPSDVRLGQLMQRTEVLSGIETTLLQCAYDKANRDGVQKLIQLLSQALAFRSDGIGVVERRRIEKEARQFLGDALSLVRLQDVLRKGDPTNDAELEDWQRLTESLAFKNSAMCVLGRVALWASCIDLKGPLRTAMAVYGSKVAPSEPPGLPTLDQRPAYEVKEVARFLQCSRSNIRKLRDKSKLTRFKRGFICNDKLLIDRIRDKYGCPPHFAQSSMPLARKIPAKSH